MRLILLSLLVLGFAGLSGCDTNALPENDAAANQAAIIRDGLDIVDDAQAWAREPAPDGGGGMFYGMTLDTIGYDTGTNAYYENSNGRFLLATATGSPGAFILSVCNQDKENKATFYVTGFEEDDIYVDPEHATCPT